MQSKRFTERSEAAGADESRMSCSAVHAIVSVMVSEIPQTVEEDAGNHRVNVQAVVRDNEIAMVISVAATAVVKAAMVHSVAATAVVKAAMVISVGATAVVKAAMVISVGATVVVKAAMAISVGVTAVVKAAMVISVAVTAVVKGVMVISVAVSAVVKGVMVISVAATVVRVGMVVTRAAAMVVRAALAAHEVADRDARNLILKVVGAEAVTNLALVQDRDRRSAKLLDPFAFAVAVILKLQNCIEDAEALFERVSFNQRLFVMGVQRHVHR